MRSGEIHQFDKTGMVLGVVERQRYDAAGPIDLEPGDLLFIHSDGVDETRNPEREMFGTERLHEAVLAAAGGSAEEVLAGVEDALACFARSATQDDDLTMLAIKLPR